MAIMMRAGQERKEFQIYRKKTRTDNKGHVTYTAVDYNAPPDGKLTGVVSSVDAREIDRWKQAEHPVSHVIVVQGVCNADAEDILVRENEKYYIQGKENQGSLGIFHLLFCDKRTGVG